MPIDPRIALMGVSPSYDVMGAFNTSRAAAQTAQANQMTMQAAQDTAQRSAAARAAARTVNFMDPTAGASFLSAYGADVAEPYLAAGARAAGTGVAQAGNARAQITQDREGQDRIRASWGRGLVSALADSSDTGLATLRGRLIADGVPEAEVDATLAQIGSMDAAVRPDFIRNLASTDKDARDAMTFVAPKPERINRGGTIVTVDMNPNSATYNQEVRTDTVTASPNRQQVVQLADGTFAVVDLPTGQSTQATLPDGTPAVGRVPGTANTQTQQSADLARQRASVTMREGATTMRGALRTLYDEGFLRGSRDTPVTGAGKFLRDAVPGARGLTLSMNPNADAAAQVAEGTISSMVGQLKDLYGTSSRAMDAVRELELALAQFGSGRGNYDAGITLLNNLESRLNTINELYRRDMGLGDAGGGAAAGGANLPPVGPEGARVRSRSNGTIMVSRGGQWVPE